MGTCYWSPDGGTTNYTMTKEVAPLNFSNLNNITTNIQSDHLEVSKTPLSKFFLTLSHVNILPFITT